MKKRLMLVLSGAALLAAPGVASAKAGGSVTPPAILKFHQSLVTLDTHLDTPASVALEGGRSRMSMISIWTIPRSTCPA